MVCSDPEAAAFIHMNGRVYEPSLGRMLSPDPVTQAPEDGRNYNRYTYASNNPLSFVDLTGFFDQPSPAVGGGGVPPSLRGNTHTGYDDFGIDTSNPDQLLAFGRAKRKCPTCKHVPKPLLGDDAKVNTSQAVNDQPQWGH